MVRNIGRRPMPNTFTARVADIEFLGSFCRVGLALNGGDPVLVADFSINVVRDLSIEEDKEMLDRAAAGAPARLSARAATTRVQRVARDGASADRDRPQRTAAASPRPVAGSIATTC